MLSFFAEPKLKAAVRTRVAEHRRLDQIAQGFYWEGGRGCFIGCSLHNNRHSDFESLLGLPEWLARLGEGIFEGLDKTAAVDFPLALYDAIPVGADLEPVRARFLAWLILDENRGAVRFNSHPAVRAVGEAHLSGGTAINWPDLRRSALAAADAAAYAAADAARRHAKQGHYAAQAAKLIEILSSTKPEASPAVELPVDPAFIGYYRQVTLEAATAGL